MRRGSVLDLCLSVPLLPENIATHVEAEGVTGTQKTA